MVIAWSRISSKVIAHPPYADEGCRRQCENWQGRSGAFIPHVVDKRKQEVLGVRDAAMMPLSRTLGEYGSRALGQTIIATERTVEASTTIASSSPVLASSVPW